MEAEQIIGYRAPFLGYNNNMYTALQNLGFVYDCSITEGIQDGHDGRNFLWPYTLDAGSPGDSLFANQNDRSPITEHPGLWELPTHVLIAPPDELCTNYGCIPGLRTRLKECDPSFDIKTGKMPGMDWNMWSPLKMNAQEFIATYKYTLDLRLQGNRSPFIICLHSDIYADNYDDPMPHANAEDRRNALKECLAYTVSIPETRTVTMANLISWLENPATLL